MRAALIALLLLLPTLSMAMDAPPFHGAWQVHLSAEEVAQVDALKKQAEATPEDGMAKAMLKAVLAASEAKLTISDSTLTFQVMGETVPATYTSLAADGGWTLTSKTPEGETKTLKAKMTSDGMLSLTDPNGQTSLFKRSPAK